MIPWLRCYNAESLICLNNEMLSFVVPVTVHVTYVFRRIPLDLASMSRKSLDISKG